MKRIFNKIGAVDDNRPTMFQDDVKALTEPPLIDDVDVTITGFMQAYGQRIDIDLSADDESDADIEASLDKEFDIGDDDGGQPPAPLKSSGGDKPSQEPVSEPASSSESIEE